MKVSNISFGKKIPLMQSNILDREHKTKIPVVFSEYDGYDYPSDIRNILQTSPDMNYAKALVFDMFSKYFERNSAYHFYVLEDKEQNVLGICETQRSDNNVNIEYIEAEHEGKHKYIGQTMIAMLGKMLLDKNGHNIYVDLPVATALDFYLKKCGFNFLLNENPTGPLILEHKKIAEFIKEVQNKTGSEIIDLQA